MGYIAGLASQSVGAACEAVPLTAKRPGRGRRASRRCPACGGLGAQPLRQTALTVGVYYKLERQTVDVCCYVRLMSQRAREATHFP